MVSVCFVCLGNICRSPTAELVFKRIADDFGYLQALNITSRGTSDCEEGNPIYPPAKRTLEEHLIKGEHTARQFTLQDVISNDYIIVMDSRNLTDVLNITGGKYGEKVFKLLAFTNNPRDIADPWYTRDFSRAFSDIAEGCRGLLGFIKQEKGEELERYRRHDD